MMRFVTHQPAHARSSVQREGVDGSRRGFNHTSGTRWLTSPFPAPRVLQRLLGGDALFRVVDEDLLE